MFFNHHSLPSLLLSSLILTFLFNTIHTQSSSKPTCSTSHGKGFVKHQKLIGYYPAYNLQFQSPKAINYSNVPFSLSLPFFSSTHTHTHTHLRSSFWLSSFKVIDLYQILLFLSTLDCSLSIIYRCDLLCHGSEWELHDLIRRDQRCKRNKRSSRLCTRSKSSYVYSTRIILLSLKMEMDWCGWYLPIYLPTYRPCQSLDLLWWLGWFTVSRSFSILNLHHLCTSQSDNLLLTWIFPFFFGSMVSDLFQIWLLTELVVKRQLHWWSSLPRT